ncbi:PP2C family protein-serine/threonine phosphatase [Streptomyces sp. NPDC059740]|uniref:PP2C family protein-serine/threonine phosphatase n=1 Tax=Streptomyces sp. NPDC059740 TaxID=3346926 RepID=UPI00366857E1
MVRRGGGRSGGRGAGRARRRRRRTDLENQGRHERLSPLWRWVALWLPVAMVVGGVAFDLVTPRSWTAAPLFAGAPLVAAAFYRLRATGAIAAAAVASITAVSLRLGLQGRRQVEELVAEILTVLLVSVLALGINRIVRLGDARLASVRDIAEAAQRALLPTPPERIGALAVAARYVAAQADARIGGDLYAVQDTPHGVRLIMGDVRGKGMEAVEAAVIVIGAFREAAEQEASLEAVAGRLERALQREGSRREGLDQFEGFTTAVLAEYPADARVGLRVVNRGHPPPLVIEAHGALREVTPASPALPLGMSEVAGWPDRADETDFPPGATLLLFTDGVTEARNAAGEFYDPVRRLGGRVFDSPEELLAALVADVAEHTRGETADDMALLAVRRRGPGEAEGERARRENGVAGSAAGGGADGGVEEGVEGRADGGPGGRVDRRSGDGPGSGPGGRLVGGSAGAGDDSAGDGLEERGGTAPE